MAITFSGTSPSGIDFTESTLIADLYAQLDISKPAGADEFDRNLATNYVIRFRYYYVQSNSNHYLKLQWTLEKKSNDDTRWSIPSGTYVEESNSQFGQKGTSNAPAAYMYIGSECYPRNNSTWQSSPLRNITHTLYCTLDSIASPKEAIQFRYNWINNNITYSVETPLVSIPKAKTPYDDNVVFNKDGLNKFIRDLPEFVSDHAYPITIGSANSNDLNQIQIDNNSIQPLITAHFSVSNSIGNKSSNYKRTTIDHSIISVYGLYEEDNGESTDYNLHTIFGSSGHTLLTSGEYSKYRIELPNNIDKINVTSENLTIASDKDIKIITNCQAAKVCTFSKDPSNNSWQATIIENLSAITNQLKTTTSYNVYGYYSEDNNNYDKAQFHPVATMSQTNGEWTITSIKNTILNTYGGNESNSNQFNEGYIMLPMHDVFTANSSGEITIGDGSSTINLNGTVSFGGSSSTTGLASLIGTTPIGSNTQPIYWTGSNFATTGSLDYVPIAGGTMTGRLVINKTTGLNDTTKPTAENSALSVSGAGYFAENLTANKVFNAVFNDYAEYRTTIDLTPGHVVIDQDDGSLACSTTRLQPGAQVISDTFGHAMGETETAKTPLAVAGRVLVYTFQPRENYHAGMAVCSAPDGTVDIMTREEIREYPDCIIGTVSEIPSYETWGSDNIKVDGRIWIKI